MIEYLGRSLLPSLIKKITPIQGQQGLTLTPAQFKAIQGLTTCLPADKVGSWLQKTLERSLGEVAADQYRVTETLVSVLGMVQSNFSDRFESPPQTVLKPLQQIQDQFGLNESKALSSRLQLFAPNGSASWGDRILSAHATPIARLMESFIHRSSKPHFPENLFLFGKKVDDKRDPQLALWLERIFDRPIPVDNFLQFFHLGAGEKGPAVFEIDDLYLDRGREGTIKIIGVISASSGNRVGYFDILIPGKPKDGRPWIAKGKHFRISEEYRRKNVFTHFFRRNLWFLRELGVDAMEVRARHLNDPSQPSSSRHFYAKIGFNPERSLLEALKREFRDYLAQQDSLDVHRDIDIANITELSEIAHFIVDDQEVGRNFLTGIICKPLVLHFWLRDGYPGWARLVPGTYPAELDDLQEGTRQLFLDHMGQFEGTRDLDHTGQLGKTRDEILLSYDRFGYHLADWIHNLSTKISFWQSQLSHNYQSQQDQSQTKEHLRAALRHMADILNMIQLYQDEAVEHFFHRYFRREREETKAALDEIKKAEIELNYE